jgi:hypothetical protein
MTPMSDRSHGMWIRMSEPMMHRWTPVLLLLLHAMLAAAVLGANPFKNETITPLDALVEQPAWSWVGPTIKARLNERSDVLNAILPQWLDAREQIRSGRIPLWNPSVAGGIPHLTPSYNTLTPGFLLFAAAPDPALGFYLATLFNLAMAGLGMHLFLRRRLGFLAAMTGAVTFQFCGFNAAWLYWPHVFTLMWAPWLFLAIDRCAEKPNLLRCLGIAVPSALLVLGGFPFVAEIVFAAGTLYALILVLTKRHENRWKFPVLYLAGTAFGFFLCVLPLVEFVSWMQQFDLGYREGRGSYLDLTYIDRLLPPWAYRHLRVEQTMYVGVVMLTLAAAAVLTSIRNVARPSELPLFGVVLLIGTAGLVFELFPMWLVGWIPGMTFNSWSRLIGLLDMALIVLGAVAIDHIWKVAAQRNWRPVQAAMIVLILIQIVEIGSFFRRYNGPVSADFFYPLSPAIGYMKDNTGPFDHIVADSSFHFSGTLGAYGLNEWFAHQFRTEGLKSALREMAERPFRSRTSSKLRAEDIKPGSAAMSRYNVRYIAVSSTDPAAAQAFENSLDAREFRKALPAMPAHRYTQSFDVSTGPLALTGVSVRLATYRQSGLEGSVTLTLRRQDEAAAIQGVTIDAMTVVDNAMANFFFPSVLTLQEGRYELAIEYEPRNSAKDLTAWSIVNDADRGLRVDGSDHPGVLDYVFHTPNEWMQPFRRVFTAAGISVYENPNSPNGPYFISSVQQTPTRNSARNLQVENYEPDFFTIRYNGHEPGYLVVPMKITSEWAVAVDGVPVDYRLKDGVLPAVPVSHPSVITFKYHPRALQYLPLWFAGLFAGLIALPLLCYLADRRRHTRMSNHETPREPDR